MDVFQAILIGIIEGVTEFLPISSTGHQILATHLLGIPQTEFLKSFEIIIQLGAILAVLMFYWRSFLDIELLKKLFVAFVPTGIIGLTFYKLFKTYLLGNETIVLGALFLGGIVLIAFEYWHDEATATVHDVRSITYLQALFIGLFQAIAIVPGVSRSAATIIGGLWLGLGRVTIVEFSFLLAVPTMAAATGLDLIKNAKLFSADQAGVLSIGFVVSFVVAAASIRWLLAFVRGHNFVYFGIYRIILALVFFFFILR
jgi:undecaprenyl-diphosphatase